LSAENPRQHIISVILLRSQDEKRSDHGELEVHTYNS